MLLSLLPGAIIGLALGLAGGGGSIFICQFESRY